MTTIANAIANALANANPIACAYLNKAWEGGAVGWWLAARPATAEDLAEILAYSRSELAELLSAGAAELRGALAAVAAD